MSNAEKFSKAIELKEQESIIDKNKVTLSQAESENKKLSEELRKRNHESQSSQYELQIKFEREKD